MELFTAIDAREDLVHRRRETRRVAHRLGPSCERPTPELAVRRETRELEQSAPHQPSRAHQVEECVLREHRPTLSLPPFEHVVEHRRGHRDHDRARDKAREERMTRPEPVGGEVPGDCPEQDKQAEDGDNPRRAHVRPRRLGAARTDTATSHLPPSILRRASINGIARNSRLVRALDEGLGSRASPARSPVQGCLALVVRFENGQRTAGTRRVHEREHARSPAGTGDTHLQPN
jgi:hypothetical protein